MTAGPQTRRVADFVGSLRWDDLPADVQTQAVCCVLDLCGAAVAGSRTEAARTAAAYALYAHGTGPSTIIGTGAGSTPVGAALANGFAASALDIDDGYRPVKGHPGAVVFPAVLAAAEEAKTNGVEFLTALVAGYEVAMRAGHILHLLYDFYHGSGAWAPIGAAAGVARLLDCDAEQTWHALGIAEFHAAMTPEMRSVAHPSMLKDGIGWGAMVGIASSQLAARGFTGIPALFDASSSGSSLTASLGDEYLILDLYFKPNACCRWAQPAIEGALSAARHIGAAAADVAWVRVHTFVAATRLHSSAPRTTEEAQFSLAWPIACALIDGVVGPDQVAGENLADPARRELAARVEVVVDAQLEKAFPEQALAWVEIETKGGTYARSEISAAQGDAGSLFGDREVMMKFANLTEPVLGADRARKLASAVRSLPEAPGLSEITSLILRPSSTTASDTTRPGSSLGRFAGAAQRQPSAKPEGNPASLEDPHRSRYGIDRPRVERAVREILVALGENPQRKGLRDTPRRVADAYAFLFSGVGMDPAQHLKETFQETHKEMIFIRDIPFASMCEHHFLPMVGKAHVGYMPDGKVAGLSKLVRVVEGYSRRLQLQERLTAQIADALYEDLDSRGSIVVIEADQSCMTMRGVQKPGSITVTSAVRGIYEQDNRARQEAMDLITGPR